MRESVCRNAACDPERHLAGISIARSATRGILVLLGAILLLALARPASALPPRAGECDLYPDQPRGPNEYEAPQCYAPDMFVATGGSSDYDEDTHSEAIRNGLYQRWLWCGTSCWLLVNDVDKEMVIFDGYVSKMTMGSSDDPRHFWSYELDRIQQLANLVRYLNSLGYRLKGILVMHWHGDHTVDVPVLLKALTKTSGRVKSASDYGRRVHESSVALQYPALDYCIPVIDDEYAFNNFIIAGTLDGGSNPSTNYVRFQHPTCTSGPACDEHTRNLTNGQRFNISSGLHDGTSFVPCPDCTSGQFKLGHFEFNAYVWDHGTGNFGEGKWRTLAFRVWHDKAHAARRTLITGSVGEMQNESDFQDSNHNGHSHRVHDLLLAADGVFGDHAGGYVWTDMLLLAWTNSTINSNDGARKDAARAAGDNIRFYERNSGPDVGLNPVGYVLANHHDSNFGATATGSDRYTQMLSYMDSTSTRTTSSHWWKGQTNHVRVLGRQLRRNILEYKPEHWTNGHYTAVLASEAALLANTGPDRDCDGIADQNDNCELTPNPDQLDMSPVNGVGDACEGNEPGCTEPPASLIAWWRLDELGNPANPMGQTYVDSALDNDATDAGAGAIITTPTGGYVHGGLRFTGDGDHLVAPQQVDHDPSNMTIDAWVKVDPDASPGELPIVEWGSAGTARYRFTVGTSGELSFTAKCDGGPLPDSYFTDPGYVVPGVWTHVAISHTQDVSTSPVSPGPLRFFVNGVIVPGFGCENGACPVEGPDPTAVDRVNLANCASSSGHEWRIGRTIGDGLGIPGNFDGVLDEIEIMDCALSEPDIAAIAAAGHAGKCKGGPVPPAFALPKQLSGCLRAMNKSTTSLAKTSVKNVVECRKLAESGKLVVVPPSNCDMPDTNGAYSKAAEALLKAEIKHEAKVCKACGGEDRFCDGIDDIPPAALGFRSCPVPCDSVAINGFDDVVACNRCVTEEAVHGMATAVFDGPTMGSGNLSTQKCRAAIGKSAGSGFLKGLSGKGKETFGLLKKVDTCPPITFNTGGSKIAGLLDKIEGKLATNADCLASSLPALGSCSSASVPELAACVRDAIDLHSTTAHAAIFGLHADPGPGSVCGDGIVAAAAGEICDPPFDVGGAPGCSSTCASTCGDSVLDTILGEGCDDGPGNSDVTPNACRTDCLPARCGDTVVDAGEGCDDGNESNADPCTNLCVAATCGDGQLCSDPACTSGPGSGPEQCDPGAGTAGCTVGCQNNCGNGVFEPGLGEECDNGVANSDTTPDACRTDCRTAHCLDGIIDAGEACDPGQTEKGDPNDPRACRESCVLAGCGDGFVCSDTGCITGGGGGFPEDCDPPFTMGGERGCGADCWSTCGDGVVNGNGELCDDAGPSATCDDDCSLPACGDGRWNQLAGEGCDDGNVVSNDGCSSTCVAETCTCSGGSNPGSPCLPTAVPSNCPGGNCVCS